MFQLNRGEFAFKQLHFEMDLRAHNLYVFVIMCVYLVGWLAINIFAFGLNYAKFNKQTVEWIKSPRVYSLYVCECVCSRMRVRPYSLNSHTFVPPNRCSNALNGINDAKHLFQSKLIYKRKRSTSIFTFLHARVVLWSRIDIIYSKKKTETAWICKSASRKAEKKKKHGNNYLLCNSKSLSKHRQEVVRLLFTSIQTSRLESKNKQKYQQNKQKSANGRALRFSGGLC